MFSDPFLHLKADFIALLCILEGYAVNLHRGNRLFKISRSSLEQNCIANGKRLLKLYNRGLDMREIMRDNANDAIFWNPLVRLGPFRFLCSFFPFAFLSHHFFG